MGITVLGLGNVRRSCGYGFYSGSKMKTLSALQQENLEHFFDYSIDVANRTLYVGGGDTIPSEEPGVDYMLAERVLKGLLYLDRLPGEITIILNNPGGSEYHGLAIYDALMACANHVTVKVFGMAFSMAGIILQAADLRLMAPNARFMMHYGTWPCPDDHPQIVYRWAEEGKKFDAWMEKMFRDRMREAAPQTTLDDVKKLLQFDTILNTDETIKLGLADGKLE
jgi:ATP-dependent protease ClpP protease subunit